MFDDRKNFAYSRVLFAPNPSDTGVSLTVLAGDGVIFPTPPFNATVWPEDSNPLGPNAEIVRVTNIVGDVFTITRHQEGTTARNIGVGWQIMAGLTAKTIDDIETAITDNTSDITTNAAAIAVNGAAIAALQANTTPTITSFVNAQHDHLDAAGGGLLLLPSSSLVPTYFQILGNNGASRQTIVGATTGIIAGETFTYTSGNTNELLEIWGQALITVTNAGGQLGIYAAGTLVSRTSYVDNSFVNQYITHEARCLYPMAANTTITFDLRFRNISGTATVANSNGDPANGYAPSLECLVWGR